MPTEPTLTPAELSQALAQVLAELEMVAAGNTYRFDKSMASEPLGIPTSGGSAAERFRRRLMSINAGLERRLNGAESVGDRAQREREWTRAHEWFHEARSGVLEAARKELVLLTGRTGVAPERQATKYDTVKGIEEMVREEAPGKSAERVAEMLGVQIYTVRRIYFAMELDTKDGSLLSTSRQEREARAVELSARGLTTRQIASLTGMHQTQVVRVLKRAPL